MGEDIAAEQAGTDVVLFDDGILAVYLLDAFLAQPDVEYAELTDDRLELWEQECQLGLLERQRMGGPDDVGADIVGVVLGHQARRNIDADDLCRRGVDILDQRGEATGQRFVESRAEQSVDDHRALLQTGRVELLDDFDELMDALVLLQTLLVGGAVGRQAPADVEQVDADCIVLLSQHACHGQCVAAVVAGAGKDDNGY